MQRESDNRVTAPDGIGEVEAIVEPKATTTALITLPASWVASLLRYVRSLERDGARLDA